MKTRPAIETRRLVLRPFTLADAPIASRQFRGRNRLDVEIEKNAKESL